MDSIEHFSQTKNVARVKAGFKGGGMFENPVKVPARQIVDAVPPEVKEKLQAAPITMVKPTDPWNQRR